LTALDNQAAADAIAAGERLHSIPMGDRAGEAFGRKKLLVGEKQALQILLDHPGSTAESLSSRAGWPASGWLARFAGLLRKRQAGFVAGTGSEQSDDSVYAQWIAELSADGHWTMKPDVVEALAKLGMMPRQPADAA